ncbi:MAG: polysaccharide biosynthesis tyrosine autokinase [Rhodoferax sp.]|jgi:succinoglycan biosynthesis transport protein ExoP|uniref:GumC family protein n=1 Tax=Rhodoferax sp. TaxID=50421 RepID=UPI001B755F80|nr:polysaccharide biosynthesis tyrosine autokinase [Rhodoferax sp.]MBP9149913.1 polysaccharide biosynthesis tyrosine autokinase [Rhodoferax sp.]MBP9736846.1 polysaccharide biosynthesis tyrosine autokinase [Rhodoferax sp.]
MSEPFNAGSSSANPLFFSDPADQSERLDFVEYWRTLRKRKWAILAFALLITLLAGVIAFTSTPIYEAKTTLLIETNKQKVVTIEDVYAGVGATREYFQTQVEIIKSREVSLKTIAKLKLYDHPDFDPRAPKKGLAAFKEQIGFATAEAPREWNESTLAEAAYGGFAANLSIEPIRLSQLVVVKFTSPDAALAARVSNALAQTYIENDLDARYQMTRTASAWLQERLSGLKGKLNESEQLLQNYREKQGIVNIKEAAQSGAAQQIEQLQSRLIEARTRRAEIEATYKIVKEAANAGDLASQPAVLNSGQVADAKRQANEAARKLADVSQRYGKEHPRYLQADSDAKAASDNLLRQIELVVGGINHEYERARSTEKMLEGTLASARGSVQNINRKEFELGVYEREVESNRQMYDMFMKRAKETNVAGDLQTTVARVVDTAAVPTIPIKPKKSLIVGVALFMGLLVGMMIALLMEVLDNTLKNTEDVESRLKQPLLTVLPMLSKKDAMRKTSGHLITESPNSLYSEAIRTARTGVLLSSVDLASRVLLVTSSVPGEGKTTFSSNLALAHAFTQKTLLVDADMRRPSVARAHGLDVNAPGLSELVAGTAKLEACLQAVKDSNLVVLGSGAIPPNPLELLHSERFAQTIESLRKDFETIIIDSPPVELVSDALVLASRASGIIFVSKAQTTPLPMVRKALQRLRRADGHIIGVVLNALDFNKAEKYYGEYSGYGKHGYGTYGSAYGTAYGAASAAKTKAA